jgi:opacity protein-like surface antigen
VRVSRADVTAPKESEEDTLLRKFALVAAAFMLLFATLAHAQQVDVAVGLATLGSSSPASGGLNFQQPAEKGGSHINLSVDIVGFGHRRLGLSAETSFRLREASYAGYETYRPILTDVNAFFQPRLSKKLGLDLMAGVGVASNRFNLTSSCNLPGCINYTSSYHFMEDFGGGIRYYVWHNLFVRPEIRYYHIQNNVEFHSDNLVRVGASIGFTLGRD